MLSLICNLKKNNYNKTEAYSQIKRTTNDYKW